MNNGPDESGQQPPIRDKSLGARVYTVPTGRPFLDALARAILSGDLPAPGGPKPGPLDLPSYTLLLPTRRATRALQSAFLRASGGRAMLLPRVLPISEGQEDLTLITEVADTGWHASGGGDIPLAVGEMERRLALTSLVLRWATALQAGSGDPAEPLSDLATRTGMTPAQAAQLAAELARLMDMIETENVPVTGFKKLVPDEHSAHWQLTLEFLSIVTQQWPAYLAERGLTSAADRRNRLILAEARRYAAHPPAGPVVVAGVTGSVPATAELMKAVARLPHGAIVLPCLDLDLDEESWRCITPRGEKDPGHPEHPQHGLKKLLDGLGLARTDVVPLADIETKPHLRHRARLVSEALRPASTTGRWAGFAAEAKTTFPQDALDGLSLIAAPTAQDEAETVALILREALETPGRTAALVSPDRLLARRVAIRLESWGIRVDDSAGRPFGKTVPGAFLDLVVETAASRFAPREVMALLKHPLARLGLDPFAVRRAGRALELAAFRGPYLGHGLAGVEAALEQAARNAKPGGEERVHPAVRRLFEEDWDGARDLVRRLTEAFQPLSAMYARDEPQDLSALARAHVATAVAVARLPEAEKPDASAPVVANSGDASAETSPLWSGEAGETALRFFSELFAPGLPQPVVPPSDYADLYRSLIAGENVRPRIPVHPRLFIWGPFEARLQQADVMILGSLNDGTWPEPADPGPWLNRSMRMSLGLPSPEEKIGYAAHDFSSFLGAERVIMTRALKVDGVPTVPSRWLMRLGALLSGLGQADRLAADDTWLRWARTRDAVQRSTPIRAPRPRPPIEMRPRRISVSRVETWMANPYAIFAREVLRLEPLAGLGEEPGAALRGSIIHAALAEFTRRFPVSLPSNIRSELLSLARAEFDAYKAHPRVAAFWMQRFERFAEWFAQTEPRRRESVTRVVAETSGKLVLTAPAGPFTITARADRIDAGPKGLAITDYKTGNPPPATRVKRTQAPQLPLEAAIAAAGLFEGVPRQEVTSLRYISASGGDPPGTESTIEPEKGTTLAQLAESALDGLGRLIAKFDDPATPYEPKRRAGFSYDYDDYAHLARVAEWSSGYDGEDGGADA